MCPKFYLGYSLFPIKAHFDIIVIQIRCHYFDNCFSGDGVVDEREFGMFHPLIGLSPPDCSAWYGIIMGDDETGADGITMELAEHAFRKIARHTASSLLMCKLLIFCRNLFKIFYILQYR